MNQKTDKPIAICSECGNFVYGKSQITARCAKIYERLGSRGKRCRGINVPAVEFDFKECSTCGATGWQGENRCGECDGKGWFAKKRGAH
jgi:hypothetical protein